MDLYDFKHQLSKIWPGVKNGRRCEKNFFSLFKRFSWWGSQNSKDGHRNATEFDLLCKPHKTSAPPDNLTHVHTGVELSHYGFRMMSKVSSLGYSQIIAPTVQKNLAARFDANIMRFGFWTHEARKEMKINQSGEYDSQKSKTKREMAKKSKFVIAQ